MLNLMEQRSGGTLNLVNPEPISLYEVVKIYKEVEECLSLEQIEKLQIVDDSVNPASIGVETERAQQLLATKGNCALATEKLQMLAPVLSAKQSLVKHFTDMAAK